jgi:hypothetical protein
VNVRLVAGGTVTIFPRGRRRGSVVVVRRGRTVVAVRGLVVGGLVDTTVDGAGVGGAGVGGATVTAGLVSGEPAEAGGAAVVPVVPAVAFVVGGVVVESVGGVVPAGGLVDEPPGAVVSDPGTLVETAAVDGVVGVDVAVPVDVVDVWSGDVVAPVPAPSGDVVPGPAPPTDVTGAAVVDVAEAVVVVARGFLVVEVLVLGTTVVGGIVGRVVGATV